MCGIIGYIGNKDNVGDILLGGLKRLEYRGYDSCGMAVLNDNIILSKDIGKVDEVNKKLRFSDLKGKTGVAHSRWATHGTVSQENAHPHLSNSGKIAVVHNGIIENYQELKNFLISKGFNFYSQTDTEVIPNLIEYFMEGKDFFEATKIALNKLEGSYAIVAIHEDEKNLIAARKDSPLVIGVGDREYFIASDIPAFLEYTKNVIYLEEKDVVVLNDKIKIFNLKENSFVKRPINTIEWSLEQV